MSKFTLVKLDGTKVPVELSDISIISGIHRNDKRSLSSFNVTLKSGGNELITGKSGDVSYQRLRLIDAFNRHHGYKILKTTMSSEDGNEDMAFTGFGRCLIGAASLLLVASIVTGFVFLFLEVTKGGA